MWPRFRAASSLRRCQCHLACMQPRPAQVPRWQPRRRSLTWAWQLTRGCDSGGGAFPGQPPSVAALHLPRRPGALHHGLRHDMESNPRAASGCVCSPDRDRLSEGKSRLEPAERRHRQCNRILRTPQQVTFKSGAIPCSTATWLAPLKAGCMTRFHEQVPTVWVHLIPARSTRTQNRDAESTHASAEAEAVAEAAECLPFQPTAGYPSDKNFRHRHGHL